MCCLLASHLIQRNIELTLDDALDVRVGSTVAQNKSFARSRKTQRAG